LQIGQQSRFQMPQACRERIVRGEDRQHAVLDKPGFDARRQIVGQQFGKVAFERGDLLDPGAQRGKCIGAGEHVGEPLRATRVERRGERPRGRF
jgi:hypothetical protein